MTWVYSPEECKQLGADLVHCVSSDILLGKLDYPYLKYQFTLADIQKKFEALKRSVFHYRNDFTLPIDEYPIRTKTPFLHTLLPQQPIYLVSHPKMYGEFNSISDFFQEEARIQAKRMDTPHTPKEYWMNRDNHPRIIQWIMKYVGQCHHKAFRSAMYRLCGGECINFKVTIVVALFKAFGSRRILDFSAGWGDRLVGALACEVEHYVGVDPNPRVHAGYKAIVDAFANSTTRVSLVKNGFLETHFDDNDTFDMIFTSPPFYELETYNSKDDKQSTKQFPKLEDWTRDFLCESLKKAWQRLEKNKYMVIAINDYSTKDKSTGVDKWTCFTEVMILYVQAKLPDAHFLGVVGSAYPQLDGSKLVGFRPMWVFQKQAHADKARWANSLLRQAYPFLV